MPAELRTKIWCRQLGRERADKAAYMRDYSASKAAVGVAVDARRKG